MLGRCNISGAALVAETVDHVNAGWHGGAKITFQRRDEWDGELDIGPGGDAARVRVEVGA